MSLVCEETHSSVKLDMLKLINGTLEEIKEGQKTNVGLVDRLVLINQDNGGDFRIDENCMMSFGDRVYVEDIP